jgi:integrase
MGKLFDHGRIRERFPKGRRKPLAYTPIDKAMLDESLEEHNKAIKAMTVQQQDKATNLWMRNLVHALVSRKPEEDWMTIFNGFIKILDYPWRRIDCPESNTVMNWFKPIRSFSIEDMTFEYLKYYAKCTIVRYPHAGVNDELTYELLRYVLENGTPSERRKVPSEIYAKYCSELPIKSVVIVRTNLQYLLKLWTSRKLWLEYFSTEAGGLKDIRDVTLSDLKAFEAWRFTHRLPNGSKLPNRPMTVSTKHMKTDFAFIKSVFRYALAEKILTHDPSTLIRVHAKPVFKNKHKVVLPAVGQRPIDFETLKKIVRGLPDYYHSLPVDSDAEKRREIRLDCLTTLFLLATGIRPKECNEWRIENGKLALYGEKNKHGIRNQEITPTIRSIIYDSQFQENQKCKDIASRTTEFLKRTFASHITAYRLRHSFSVLNLVAADISLPLLSDQLGHAESSTTERIYGSLKGFLKTGTSKDVSEFLRWFHHDLFHEINFNHPDYQIEEKINAPIKDNEVDQSSSDTDEGFNYLKKKEGT